MGKYNGEKPPDMYCQSRHNEKRPRPSSPLAPPKILVKVALFWFARQKMLIPIVYYEHKLG
jgi:hypothetical protein